MQPHPTPWTTAAAEGARSGTVASVLSTVALAAAGPRDRDDPAQPVNGPSQWLWGRWAPFVPGFSVRHTVVGYAIHHAMSVMWAVLFEKFRPRAPDARAAAAVAGAAAVTAAFAATVDFRVVPKRLSPGFEARLSRAALVAVYAGFALGLAGAALARDRSIVVRPPARH